jgi:type IV fimbrial biogenesis protein FimT
LLGLKAPGCWLLLAVNMRNATLKGFTLIELIVVVALIAIMITLAAPSFVRFQRSSELTGVANSLIGAMSAARAEAMRRNRNAYVVPLTANDWTSGWRVYVDMNGNAAYDSTTDFLVIEEARMPGSVTTPAAGLNQFSDGSSMYIMFNGSGFPRQSNGAFIAASGLELKYDNSLRRRVVLTLAGRMRVCDPVKEPTTCVP